MVQLVWTEVVLIAVKALAPGCAARVTVDGKFVKFVL